jgi:hypothetical protein
MILQDKTGLGLVTTFNSLVGNHRWGKASPNYLEELRCEFDRRNWDYSVIMNSSGEFNLADGNQVYLIEKKLFLVHEYILGMVRGEVVLGEIIQRTRLWITIRILVPFIGWENSIGIPNQALGTTRHFWTIEGNDKVREYGLELLIKSYEKVKIIDENIEIFVGIYDELQKELKAIDRLGKFKKKEKIKYSLQNGFEDNLHITYGLHLGIYDKEQFEEIILAYKFYKRKIYLNQ